MFLGVVHHALHMWHYIFAFTVLFWLWPKAIFLHSHDITGLEVFWANFAQMASLLVTLGYILVATRLFEFASLTSLLLLITVYVHKQKNLSEHAYRTTIWSYNLLDGRIGLRTIVKRSSEIFSSCWSAIASSLCRNPSHALQLTMLAVILAHSAYLRFADPLRHAALAMSDSSVTLAWTKYIENRILFHDGVYPHGFHIILSTLRKFAAIDTLYILKYTGPLNGVLIALGSYLVASRWTKSISAGLIACFSSGVLASQLHLEWERQAATNSQEYALVFLAIAWFFSWRYLQDGKRESLWSAAASYLIIGWVHTLIFGFAAFGVALLALGHLMIYQPDVLRRTVHLALAGVAAAILSTLPLAIGLLAGLAPHGSSLDYLTSRMQVSFPTPTFFDYLALAGMTFFLIASLWMDRTRSRWQTALSLLLLGAGSFAFYRYLGPMSGNSVLVSRSALLWGTVQPLAIGAGWSAMMSLLGRSKLADTAQVILAGAVMAVALSIYQPQPAAPYRMLHDSVVEQYLKINQEFLPTEWMMVSEEEGYALVLGRGWHMQLPDFLRQYNPQAAELGRESNGVWDPLKHKDLFIVTEKILFRVEMEPMVPILARREQDYQELEQWIADYRQNHDNLTIYYEDENIRIYRIHRDPDQQARPGSWIKGDLIR